MPMGAEMRSIMSAAARTICLGLLVAGWGAEAALAIDNASVPGAAAAVSAGLKATSPEGPKRADFEHETPSREARKIADWVVDSGDSGGLPFVVLDKTQARVFVFHANGQLRGAAAALVGLAVGDDAVPGIGQRKLASIRPEERTTPAGRFVAALDRNLHGGEILWVDYETAISLHPVITSNPKERRAERLATPTPLDNRISYGCINVPAEFFHRVVSPAFRASDGIVYVLPETRSARQVFPSYDVYERARQEAGSRLLSAPVTSQIDTDIVRH